jgi:hypothetical protein
LFDGSFGIVRAVGVQPDQTAEHCQHLRPEVGQGAVYEQTDSEGKKSRMEMSVVGKEMVGTEEGFWMEVGHNEGKDGNLKYGKVLVTKDFTFHKMVFVMPGSPQPMEMDMNNRKAHHGDMEKEVEKWHSVGMETITVPAGTFSCEHWQKDDGKGDVWASPKVSPMGMVKSVDNGRTMVLEKIITNAQTHITGAPVKFDPQMMRQQLGKPKP